MDTLSTKYVLIIAYSAFIK